MEGPSVYCNVCEENFNSIQELNDHLQRNHPLLNINRRFRCNYMNCEASFNNQSSLRSHRSRNHRIRVPIQNVVEEPNNRMDVDDQDALLEDLQGNNVHPEPRNLSSEEDSSNESDNNQSLSSDTESEYLESDDTDVEEEAELERENNPRNRAIGLLLLQLRSTTNISEEKIGIILKSMEDAVKEFVAFSLQQIERVIYEEENIQLGELFNIEEHVQNIKFTNDFNTKQKRMKYFQKEFDVVMPKKRILGKRFVKYGSAKTNEERPMKVKVDEMYFVPLSQILRNFSKNQTFNEILDNHVPKPNVLASFRDGSKFQNQVWRHPDSYHNILLYMDDVDMCDGLGSKAAGQQKLLMIYASTLNISPIYRSAL